MFKSKHVNKPFNENLKNIKTKEDDNSKEIEYDINDLSYNYLINTNFKNIHDPKFSKYFKFINTFP